MSERNDGGGPHASVPEGFVQVGSLAQLPAGTTIRATVGPSDLVLVNLEGRVVAIGELCLRCSRSLTTAQLSGHVLTCSGCGWKYDVELGCVDGLPALRTEVHDVQVDEGRLLVASALAAPVSADGYDASSLAGAAKA
jgi:nitrite reductase/ring-hydroxylating ferredoxin subunit